MIRKNLVWLFLLSTIVGFGQSERSIPGTYVLKEQIGIHVEPGMSYDDIHPTSYISSVDTTITRTLILDSLKNAIVTIDTSYGNSVGSFDPIIKMKGRWDFEDDTLTIEFDSVLYLYQGYITGEDTIINHVDGVKYSILPDKKNEEYELLKISITEQYRVLSFDNVRYLGTEENKVVETFIDAIIPLNEERNWLKYIRK